MVEVETYIALALAGAVVLLIYLYISAISKVFRTIGFTPQEASLILLLTLFLGWLTIPLFPYEGWWVGISLGGALVPIVICILLLKSMRVGLAEFSIGLLIVTYASYFVTRPEEGVGIVADIPFAFIPAIAAGLYSLSVFWMDITRAAPLAYSCGIIGTLVGADALHLPEMLSFPAPAETVILSIGGANIFDMVYITGIVAVGVDLIAFWVMRQRAKYGVGAAIAEFRRGGESLRYAEDREPAPKLTPGRRGRLP